MAATIVRADVSCSGKEVRLERNGTLYCVYYDGQLVVGLTSSYEYALKEYTLYMAT